MNKNRNDQELEQAASVPRSAANGSGTAGVNAPAPNFKLWSTESLSPERENFPPAPGAKLQDLPDQFVSLDELRGRPVILVFYPADWSPVCGDQVVLYNELLPEFHRYNAILLGLSVDSPWCHSAFAKDRKLRYPLLSDFEPKGAIARSYGAYRQDDGFCERALFVIDPEGVIRWSYVSPIDVNPGAGGILTALESLPLKHKVA
jgi:peroxiredoxin